MDDDEVQNALRVIQEHTRGDSFDIGEERAMQTQDPDIINIIQNPRELADMFNLTEKQAANLRSLIVGSGTGGIHRLLSEHFGSEVSAIIGALASSWVSKKIIKR